MEDIISTFHIDWKLMIAQTVNFVLVLAIFYYFAAKPLRKLMKDRTQEISGGLEDAKKNSELLEQTKEEYEGALNKARTEAVVILEKGKKEAQTQREQMVVDTKQEVARMIEKGKRDLETEKNKMVQDAKSELASLVMSATERVVGKKPVPLDAETLKKLNNL